MPVIAVDTPILAAIGDEVARGLASANLTVAGCFVRTPMLYPSGTSVVIRLDGSRDRFFVSDMGAGFNEAMMMNASHSYAAVARNLVKNSEIGFDNRSFFVAEAVRSELVGAVSAVANVSQRAVIETSLNHEARKLDADRAMLLARLDAVFGRRVERDVEVLGASAVSWEVTAKVAPPNNVIVLFEYARPHKNSVTSTVAKFHDIARLSQPPRRIVTVRDRSIMGSYVGLLSQAASVIELSSTPDDVLYSLAA